MKNFPSSSATTNGSYASTCDCIRTSNGGKKHHYTATGQIEVRGPDIVATVKGDDAYNVLDGLVEKLDEQLRERHERLKDKRNHPRDVEIDAELPKVRGA